MAEVTRKCWLTFEGPEREEPCLWKMSQAHPKVVFDIRHANVKTDLGIMAVLLKGDEDDVQGAIEFLESLGVKVDPVEGGSLVAG